MTVSIAAETNRLLPLRGKAEWWCGEKELVERLAILRDRVFSQVGEETALPSVEWDSPSRSAEVVSTLIHTCIERLRHTRSTEIEAGHRLCRLVLDLQHLAMDIYLYDTAMRGQRLADCATGLSRLRGIPNSDALLESACEELVSRCGFHRAVLSRVEAGGWKPLMLHQRSDDGADSWFSPWINKIVPNFDAPEAETLSKRRPSLVYDTANAQVYRPLIVQSGHSRSYLVAPLVHGDDVVGFLHTDHHPLPRRVDESDREVLWAFADGFGHIYERTVLEERLRAQRDSMRELFFGAIDRIDDLCDSGMEATRRGDVVDEQGPDGMGIPPLAELTEREVQVFELMATGATNQAIAEKLVITEGTVKSHVKHILRKYGAVNRAQAIAWALQQCDSSSRGC
ncbi:MAG TPA: LuxR C-terminal-related transcriptional regulator [Mycobacterium sp.]|nr:LuxR C-terminal-related transcriptional regulator [Mycobacterium sp.]